MVKFPSEPPQTAEEVWYALTPVLDSMLGRIAELEKGLAAHKADKSAYVHELTPDEYEAAVVARIDARLGPNCTYDNKHLFVGKNPPQAYLMPGATGDPHTDGANREWAIWNVYQRRKWEAEHGPVCKHCHQDVNHHKNWCPYREGKVLP